MSVVATGFCYKGKFFTVGKFEKAGDFRCQGYILGEVPITSYEDCALFCNELGTVRSYRVHNRGTDHIGTVNKNVMLAAWKNRKFI